MASRPLMRLLNPWKYQRAQAQLRIAALRQRDGDECRRCRRPMRFDLPLGHERGPRIESVADRAGGDLDALVLCHMRCNAAGVDVTSEVTERIRRKAEAELLSKCKRKRKAA